MTQDGDDLGQLDLVDFQDRSVLQKVGNSYFGVTDAKVNADSCGRRDRRARQGREFECLRRLSPRFVWSA